MRSRHGIAVVAIAATALFAAVAPAHADEITPPECAVGSGSSSDDSTTTDDDADPQWTYAPCDTDGDGTVCWDTGTGEVVGEDGTEPTDGGTVEPEPGTGADGEVTGEPGESTDPGEPGEDPSGEPTVEPTDDPTDPAPEPTDEPTGDPTDSPEPEPTDEPGDGQVVCSQGEFAAGVGGPAPESDTASTATKGTNATKATTGSAKGSAKGSKVAQAAAHNSASTLPNTGAKALAMLALVGIALVGAGAAVVVVARRPRALS
jgi:LPXTG-motif cell wall-anchored protein